MLDVVKHFHLLYSLARKQDKSFSEEHYKWVIGTKVLKEITMDGVLDNSRPIVLFGIPVKKDYFNDTNIQLWKDITNDL